MKRLTVLAGVLMVFIWSISAQDTTKLDLGQTGNVTVVNKGTSTVITIDTDSLDQVIETVASELVVGMGIVLEELSKSMDIIAREFEKSILEQEKINDKALRLESQGENENSEAELKAMKEALEANKQALKQQQQAMREQMQQVEMDYRKQLEQMRQYKTLKEVYIDNREELDDMNGTVTIEIAKPVLKSSSISKRTNADTTDVKIVGKSVIKVIEGNDISELSVGANNNIYITERGDDTVEVRLGKKIMRLTDSDKGSNIAFDNIDKYKDDEESEKNWKSKKKGKFKGHFSFIELGVNTFTTPDYSMYSATDFYPTNEFMELNYNKSVEFNINPFHQSFGIINGKTKHSAKLGLTTGLGFNFNNYTFDNNLTIAKKNNRIEPLDLEDIKGIGYEAKKSKLTTTYLTVPLSLEFTFPGGDLFVSAGVIGAVKLGSHTKFKSNSNKDKDHGDFYLNPFRYGFTAKIGYKGFSIYSNYYVSEMFQSNKGPVATPFSIGIGLM